MTQDGNLEVDIIALSFAARLILSDLDHNLIISRSLESLADFGRTEKVALYLLGDNSQSLIVQRVAKQSGPDEKPEKLRLLGTPCAEVINSKTAALYHLKYIGGLPWPSFQPGKRGRRCLCAPLIAADNKVTGVATFDIPAGKTLAQALSQPLTVLLTVIAMALETSKLFRLAVVDGLTGLYVRRYFDLRLSEEEARVRRYGGQLGILMMDLDHFKRLNDTHGHQVGDEVLKHLAKIILSSVRLELDVACRYGGEEFVVILPNTNTTGVLVVAERIRQRCQVHEFPGSQGPVHVTLSGGVALMDHLKPVPGEELLRRADEALYMAKRGGRNRVHVWGG